MVALAAASALAIAALPWLVAPHSGAGPAAPPASASASATPEPTATTAVVPLAHAEKWFLAFDYPSSWTVTDRNIPAATMGLNGFSVAQGDPAVFGFIGSGAASEKCNPDQYSRVLCATDWSLGEGTIVIRIAVSTLHPAATAPIWTGLQAVEGPDIPGAEPLTIDGLPARFSKNISDAVPYSTETIPGASEVLWWGLTSQQQFSFGYSIVAGIRGPNVEALEAQAKSLVAGIHYVPETSMLPTDPAAFDQARQSALETALAQQKQNADSEHTHAWDCFPTTVGARQQATITEAPGSNPLTRPLPATCTVESMVPTVMQGWTLTLSQTWKAGPDYSAGRSVVVLALAGNGMAWQRDYPSGLSAYPYEGTSKIPG